MSPRWSRDAQGGDPERTSLERIIAFAEKNYGVELVVAGRDDIAEVVQEAEQQEVKA